MCREHRLERLPGASEPLCSQAMNEPWYDREPDVPEHMEVSHNKVKAHLSEDVKPGGSLTVYVQPPGKEVGGRDCAAIEATYEVLDAPGTSGGLSGRFDVVKVRNYMVTSRKYKVEVLSGDTVELWPTAKPDHFVMGLIKEVCWVCGQETGDAANGLAYICEGCDKSVHAKCAGLRKNLREDEDFFCRRCRPTVAEDTIGEDAEEKAAAAADGQAAAAAGDAKPAVEKEEEAETEEEEVAGAGGSAKPVDKAKEKGKEKKGKEKKSKEKKPKDKGKEKEGGKGDGKEKRKAEKGGEGEGKKSKKAKTAAVGEGKAK